MSKDPAFLFYPNDYLGGTMGFSVDQHGLYILALIFQFNNGHFTEIQINAILNNRFSEIKHKFQTDGKTFWNKRLDSEKEKRCKYVESRKNNGRSFLLKKDKPLINKHIDIKHMGIPSGTHMENENEDENRNGVCINSEEKMQEGKPKKRTWRSCWWEYLRLTLLAFREITGDADEMQTLEKLHPNMDISLSLQKSIHEYWGTKEGWKNKKSRKSCEINMAQTLIKNLDKSRVYKPREETQRDSVREAIDAMEARGEL